MKKSALYILLVCELAYAAPAGEQVDPPAWA
jgi:hypothetical protein